MSMFAVSALSVLAACSDGAGTIEPVRVTSVTVTSPRTDVLVGDTVRLVAVARAESGTSLDVASLTWTTGDTDVATVSATGLVTGEGEGSTMITASTGGRTGSLRMTVVRAPVAALTVSPDTGTRAIGSTQQLSVTVTDAGGTELAGRDVDWSSSDVGIATVSPAGLVSFLAQGVVDIIASSEGVTGSATFTVPEPVPPRAEVAAVAIDPDSVVLEIGATHAFSASVHDSAGSLLSDRAIAWSSQSPDVARISSAGVATAVAAGSTWIRAEAEGVRDSAHVTVMPPADVLARTMAGGSVQSCALTLAGEAYCWGLGGRLGNGSDEFGYFPPQKVVGGHRFREIDIGLDNVLALTEDGVAYAWGADHGNTGRHGVGHSMPDMLLEPTPVAGGLRFAMVAAGQSHSCGITSEGDAYCWGNNWNGALGDGTEQARWVPTRVVGGQKFRTIRVGYAFSVALTPDGEAWAWGRGMYGTLGNDGTADSHVPVQVAGGHRFTDVDAGYGFTVGITADGTTYQWGATVDGVDRVPTLVPGGRRFSRVATGGGHTLALTASGELWAWGYNEFQTGVSVGGELGDGTRTSRAEPVRVLGNREYRTVAGGRNYSLAIGADGNAYGWGTNTASRAIGGPDSGSGLLEPTGPVSPITRIYADSGPYELTAGEAISVPLTVARVNGGFTLTGPREVGAVSLSVSTALPGVTATVSPEFVGSSATSSTLTIGTTTATPTGSGTLVIEARGEDGETATLEVRLTVLEPPPPPPPGEPFRCLAGSTPLADGYHCMTAQGVHTAGKYSDTELHGTWVDEDMDVCITWEPTGKQAYARYRSGSGVSQSEKGEWGAMINLDGSRYQTPRYWMIYTETADPQTALLTYDSETKTIVGWGFEKRSSCAF